MALDVKTSRYATKFYAGMACSIRCNLSAPSDVGFVVREHCSEMAAACMENRKLKIKLGAPTHVVERRCDWFVELFKNGCWKDES